MIYHVSHNLLLALKMNSLELVRRAVEETENINEFIDVTLPYTPLHLAILLRSSLQITEFLIDKGADVNSLCGESPYPNVMSKCTPLHLAISKNKRIEIDYAELLIRRGADVNIVCSGGQSALHLAVRSKNLQLVNLVLRNNANVNLNSEYGSPLMVFAENFLLGFDNLDIMKLLLEFGADANCVSDKYPNESLLHVVVKSGSVEALKLLMRHCSADININIVTTNGMTALHYAVLTPDLNDDVIRVLLDSGIDWKITDNHGICANDYYPKLLINFFYSERNTEDFLANSYFEFEEKYKKTNVEESEPAGV